MLSVNVILLLFVQFYCLVAPLKLKDLIAIDGDVEDYLLQQLQLQPKLICPKYEEAEIYFNLYTRKHEENPCRLTVENRTALEECDFKTDRKTAVLIPGWRTNGTQFFSNTKDAYLKKMDINVIIFDWTEFSPCEYFYVTVVIVPKLVYEVNKIIEMLFEYGTTASLMHLIGHSAGAQIAGIAGKNLSPSYGKYGRITALDAAGPLYDEFPDSYRITYTDAEFVDAIHTAVYVFGTGQEIGFVNFWPNGGSSQTVYPIIDIALSHMRSVSYFTESITRDTSFCSKRCGSYIDYINSKCDANDQLYMGEHCVKPDRRGDYYLQTRNHSPFGLGCDHQK